MNTIDTAPKEIEDTIIADSLDIDDPELIKFMNTKMNVEPETLLDLFYDLASFAFENAVLAPCNYLRDYMIKLDFTQFFSKEFLDQFKSTLFLSGPVMNKEQAQVNSLPAIPEESEADIDHVLVENNDKTEN